MSGGERDVFALAARLRGEGAPFVLATVGRAERPTSARPGAKAIVTADGRFRGFVGGTCVKPAVRREALRALEHGAPKLLRISPDAPPEGEEAEEGVLEEHLACVSGGALDIHLEPFLPAERLLLAGDSPVVASLAELGAALGMEVLRAEEQADLAEAASGALVVVAGHGEGEWEALHAALGESRARYAGLVASPRRAAAVRERLTGMGIPKEETARLHSPAGLDIGAQSPGEIALSILAQIVQERRRSKRSATHPPTPRPAPPAGISLAPAEDLPVDPVCGMTVSRDSPHRLEAGGKTWWFCCAGCADTFTHQQA